MSSFSRNTSIFIAWSFRCLNVSYFSASASIESFLEFLVYHRRSSDFSLNFFISCDQVQFHCVWYFFIFIFFFLTVSLYKWIFISSSKVASFRLKLWSSIRSWDVLVCLLFLTDVLSVFALDSAASWEFVRIDCTLKFYQSTISLNVYYQFISTESDSLNEAWWWSEEQLMFHLRSSVFECFLCRRYSHNHRFSITLYRSSWSFYSNSFTDHSSHLSKDHSRMLHIHWEQKWYWEFLLHLLFQQVSWFKYEEVIVSRLDEQWFAHFKLSLNIVSQL